MCWEDIKIVRSTRTTRTEFTIGATSTKLFGYNPKRFALMFSNSSSGTITVNSESPVVATRGFQITTTTPPLFLRLLLEGDAVRGDWYAIGSAAGLRVTVWETELAGLYDDKT